MVEPTGASLKQDTARVSYPRMIGIGGAGTDILLHRILTDHPTDDFTFIDLSEDLNSKVQEAAQLGIIENPARRIVTPGEIPEGAGLNPHLAAFVGRQVGKKIVGDLGRARRATIYLHSLGGGTGSGLVSVMAEEMKIQHKGGIQVAVSVISGKEDIGWVNTIFNFPNINQVLDMVILVEVEAINDLKDSTLNSVGQQYARRLETELRNKLQKFGVRSMAYVLCDEYINRMVDMVIDSATVLGSVPRPADWRNFRTIISANPDYMRVEGAGNAGVRWLVPYMWPLDQDCITDYQHHHLQFFVEQALSSGCLCRADGSGEFRAKRGILLAQGPLDYLTRQNEENLMHEIEELLGMDRGSMYYTYVPYEPGVRVLLLIHPGNVRLLNDIVVSAEPRLGPLTGAWEGGLRDLEDLDDVTKGLMGLSDRDMKTLVDELIAEINKEVIGAVGDPSPMLSRYKALLNKAINSGSR